MNTLLPLMQREWLQHRFAWGLLMTVPIAVAALPLALARIEFDAEMAQQAPPELAMLLATISIVGTVTVLGLILWWSSLFIAIGSPRRDHGDRSIEFWLSLPTGHAASLATPLLVHLVLVPAAALLVGLGGGIVISALLVGRYAGIGEWLALPWGSLLVAGLALVGRIAAGLPLLLLWVLPLLLLTMLANAAFKRWGLPVAVVALGVGATMLDRVFGFPWLLQWLGHISVAGGRAVAGASGQGMSISSETPPTAALSALPAWAWHDLMAALQALFSPLMAAGLLLSAGLFYLLVLWRQRGAGVSG